MTLHKIKGHCFYQGVTIKEFEDKLVKATWVLNATCIANAAENDTLFDKDSVEIDDVEDTLHWVSCCCLNKDGTTSSNSVSFQDLQSLEHEVLKNQADYYPNLLCHITWDYV